MKDVTSNLESITVNNRYIAIDGIGRIKVLDYGDAFGYFNLSTMRWCDGYTSYEELIKELQSYAPHVILEFTNSEDMQKWIKEHQS